MKDKIRKDILMRRKSTSDSDIAVLSDAIFQNIKKSGLIDDSQNILVYLDFNKEVQTDALINYALQNHKHIYVPICIPETRELVISEITSLDDLILGFYRIREPKKDCLKIADRAVLDLVLVPGAAFDKKGNRLGYGAGYYDKFFSSLKTPVKKAALAFSFQIVDAIAADEHDVPMDFIITENEIIECGTV